MVKLTSNLTFIVATIAGGLILVATLTDRSLPSFSQDYQRQLSEFDDPKSVEFRSDADLSLLVEAIANGQKSSLDIAPYSLENVLSFRHVFRTNYLLVIYDPQSDQFIPHYSTSKNRQKKLAKTMWAYSRLVDSLRHMFPERFQPNAPEFVVAVGGGDYPHVFNTACIMAQEGPCVGDDAGPILQFGSVYKAPVLPNIIPMPMPVNLHLRCFARFARGANNGCADYRQRYPVGQWDDLIPQVVWRGTDFTYLTNLMFRMQDGQRIGEPLRQPHFQTEIESQITNSDMNVKEAATNALENLYDKLLPRWKGVVWTAKAEVEAEKAGTTPWANIKFSRGRNGKDAVDFSLFSNVGIHAEGEHMSLETLAKYKYQIDIGGGGGTTWTGTMQKLAMPGLLFHHETPMKDYFSDWMIPWEHYIPVNEDLKDLKEKYEWAENNPDRARIISENATKLVRALASHEGFEEFFNRFYREPLRRVIEAYQPLSNGETWGDVLSREENSDMIPTAITD